MRQHTITVYDFNELDDSAKEKARDWFRSLDLEGDWYQSVYYDAKAAGSILGIEIDEINFSGFSSQGDGACFTGRYRYLSGSLTDIMEEFPNNQTLHNIAAKLKLVCHDVVNGWVYTEIKRNSYRYSHENCVSMDYNYAHGTFEVTEDWEQSVDELLREFMRWIYARLETEYEYLTSDAQVGESIKASGYEFTADGEVI